ncbi:hypothetical protein NP233_g2915 [Leucocoprinus birnbaumii]|uniref:Uncharacterized protein n=1 Tax=Leucocoprinus birnbaumii TaxID=56174 RepID=A0AAD5YYQ8_9AGAR|nr:hypothetical protein NP233_g2915 [Leucocoprinus birnbaumii]
MYSLFILEGIQDVIRVSAGLDIAHEGSTATAPGPATVFRSPTSASQAVHSPAEPSYQQLNVDDDDEELVGIFFEANMDSKESMNTKLVDGLVGHFADPSNTGDGTITKVDCRLYQPYGQLNSVGSVPTVQGTLIVNCMTPSAESEETFNDWYAEEHIPRLKAVPGWRSSRRYILVGNKLHSIMLTAREARDVPRYLALHEWEDRDGSFFETSEYKAAVDTPWRTKVMADVGEKQRFVMSYFGELA